MGGNKKYSRCSRSFISQKSYNVKKDFYLEFKEKIENSDSFIRKENDSFLFDLRAFVTKN